MSGKVRRTLRVGAEESSKVGSNNNRPSNENKPWYRRLQNIPKSKDWHWIFILVLCVVVALAVKALAMWLLADMNMGFIWVKLIELAVTILILLVIASVTERSRVGVAVALIVLILFIRDVSTHDYPQRVKEDKAKVERTSNLIYSNIDYLRLNTGTYAFELEAGEETAWRGFPSGKTKRGGFSSKDYDFILIFDDGTSYLGGPSIEIPEKINVFWKIKSLSKQTVYVTVL